MSDQIIRYLLSAALIIFIMGASCAERTQAPGPIAASANDLTAPSGPVLDSVLGISSHISRSTEHSEERLFEFDRLQNAGVKYLRIDFSWRVIEPRDNEWHPEGYDVLLDLAVESGTSVVAILDYGVDWAMPDGSHNEIPSEAFADFAGYVAGHFGDRLRYYEVWNEPDVVRFWKPWPNPHHYGRLLEAASAAIRENDPDAVVIFGGMSPAQQHFFGAQGLWKFMAGVHGHHPEMCEWFDVMAIHPYTFFQQTSPETGITEHNLIWYDLPGSIKRARAMLGEIGCHDKEIWITEMGWPHTFIGQERQAAYLVRGMLLAMSERAEKTFFYTFWDGPKSRVFTEDAFGLFTFPGGKSAPKPSYRAVTTTHQLLGNMRFSGDLGRALGWDDGFCRALAFISDDGQRAVVVWKETSSGRKTVEVNVPLPAEADSWKLVDQYGTTISQGEAGPVLIEAGMDVIYLLIE